MTAQTPERDLQAEQDFAEWRGWMEAQGYGFDDDSYQAEAFAAGMQAARDLAAVTAQTPERDTRAETLAKIACEAFCTADVAEAGRDRSQARWEAAALAVAAHVVNPTAQDYDNSAEIMRLRDLVAEILADFWAPERFEGISEGLRDAQARVDDYRERAGLERQQ